MNENKKNIAKANVEIEGLMVPDEQFIVDFVDRYMEVLGKDSAKSLLYALNCEVNKENENEHKNRRSSK